MSFPSSGGGCFRDSTPALSQAWTRGLCRQAVLENNPLFLGLTSVPGSGEEAAESGGGGGSC